MHFGNALHLPASKVHTVNQSLLDSAYPILTQRPNLRWIIGGACSGKSTVARAISRRTGIPVYDMDEQFFGRYQFTSERHPATSAWFTAGNPLAYMLSLSWKDFDALYRAANAEMLDLMAADLATSDPEQPLLIDGGITHPSVLAQVFPSQHVVCLKITDVERVRTWETAADRADMRDWVHALPDGDAMWRKFLHFDKMMTETLVQECEVNSIGVIYREATTTIDELLLQVARFWNMEQTVA